MHEFFDLSKKCYDSYCYCPFKKKIENVCVLLINIENFVKKILQFFKKSYKVIF